MWYIQIQIDTNCIYKKEITFLSISKPTILTFLWFKEYFLLFCIKTLHFVECAIPSVAHSTRRGVYSTLFLGPDFFFIKNRV